MMRLGKENRPKELLYGCLFFFCDAEWMCFRRSVVVLGVLGIRRILVLALLALPPYLFSPRQKTLHSGHPVAVILVVWGRGRGVWCRACISEKREWGRDVYESVGWMWNTEGDEFSSNHPVYFDSVEGDWCSGSEGIRIDGLDWKADKETPLARAK